MRPKRIVMSSRAASAKRLRQNYENLGVSTKSKVKNQNENTEQARADESSLSVCRAKGVSTEGQNQNFFLFYKREKDVF